MAHGDPYCTYATFRARAKLVTDEAEAQLTPLLLAITEAIDNWCGQSFNKSDADETLTLSSPWHDVLEIPGGVVSVTGIATDDGTLTYPTAWTADSWLLGPANAERRGRPYTEIRRHPNGSFSFPVMLERPIQVTGVFGWPAVPYAIAEAAYLQANRVYHRWKAPFGIVGSEQLGSYSTIPGLDKDVRAFLSQYRVRAFG